MKRTISKKKFSAYSFIQILTRCHYYFHTHTYMYPWPIFRGTLSRIARQLKISGLGSILIYSTYYHNFHFLLLHPYNVLLRNTSPREALRPCIAGTYSKSIFDVYLRCLLYYDYIFVSHFSPLHILTYFYLCYYTFCFSIVLSP